MRLAALALPLVVACSGAKAGGEGFEIPYDDLTESDRAPVRTVVLDPTIATDLGEEKVAAPIELYEFLLDHLDFTGRIVRRFDLGGYDIAPMGEGAFHIDDGEGAVADVRLVYDGAVGDAMKRRVYFARGYFEIFGRFRVYGDAVIFLDYAPDGERALVTDAAIRFRARSDVLDRLSRLARKTLGRVVKSKAALFVRAAKDASELAAREPTRVHRELDAVGASGAPGASGAQENDAAVLAEFQTRFARE